MRPCADAKPHALPKEEAVAGTYQPQVSLQRARQTAAPLPAFAGCTDLEVLVGWLQEPLIEVAESIHASSPFQGTQGHSIRAAPALQTPGAILWMEIRDAQVRVLTSGDVQVPEHGPRATMSPSH